MLAEMAMLMLTCAPQISPITLNAVINHESSSNPYAIGVNNETDRLKTQPKDLEQAISIANDLIAKGIDFDAGLGQINIKNWQWLGLDAKSVFEPCVNLQAAQQVLINCYTRAAKTHKQEQDTLSAALSCYNTGNLKNGFSNGYVSKVIAQANNKVIVPAITTEASKNSNSTTNPALETTINKKRHGVPDGFTSRLTKDGFSNF